jgi:hypothetical protein
VGWRYSLCWRAASTFFAAAGMVKVFFGKAGSIGTDLFRNDSRQSPKKLTTLSTLNPTAILDR